MACQECQAIVCGEILGEPNVLCCGMRANSSAAPALGKNGLKVKMPHFAALFRQANDPWNRALIEPSQAEHTACRVDSHFVGEKLVAGAAVHVP